MGLTARWIDDGREPQCPPDPRYPRGIDIDMSSGASASCRLALPYPAPRCGVYLLECDVCGLRAVITTAGRVDDPRSVVIACKMAS